MDIFMLILALAIMVFGVFATAKLYDLDTWTSRAKVDSFTEWCSASYMLVFVVFVVAAFSVGFHSVIGSAAGLIFPAQLVLTIILYKCRYSKQSHENWFDKDGYNMYGYNKDGYSREGYDRDGCDKDGYNIHGYDKDGYDKNGYDRHGYDRDGYDKDGYDRGGYGRDGYGEDGYDIHGHDRRGDARGEPPEGSEQSNVYGRKYKELVKSKLKNMGYAVETIGASDDWSIDLIASKSPDGYKTAIRCKNYSKPVGDKAVLEVHADMSHYLCDIGAVVTNNTFTKSASELAERNDIILCEHSRIDELDLAIENQMEILSESSGPGLRMEDDVPGMFEDFRPFN